MVLPVMGTLFMLAIVPPIVPGLSYRHTMPQGCMMRSRKKCFAFVRSGLQECITRMYPAVQWMDLFSFGVVAMNGTLRQELCWFVRQAAAWQTLARTSMIIEISTTLRQVLLYLI